MTPSTNNQTDTLSLVCRQIQSSLSEYVDNSLSAHQMWDIERHLTTCQECSATARQMQATVELLHTMDRLDTSDDFMAKLHARLDTVEPEPMRRTTLHKWLKDLTEQIRIDLTARRMPVLNFGIAAAAMGLIVLVTLVGRPNGVSSTVVPSADPVEISHVVPESEDLQRNLALTASDPLGDVAAENLRITDSSANGSGSTHSSAPTNSDGS